ncbi:CYFIP-related Rac1 interactor A-like isoform X1 [Manacus candei]|uniref:CYFIP-related Rac1 interactor A-like isoform X1 n=1 Tax=Manacus candei TaxID=415023 RepID=UPI0022268BEC|nr:CYFIP-related Rac1 interactor A-like isoform X1 [Manacus candei]
MSCPHLCCPGVSPGRGSRPMAGGCHSTPLPRGSWGQPRAKGCSGSPVRGAEGSSGTPMSRTGHRAARTRPHLPPTPRLDSSSGKETDQGENPTRKGCGLAGEPWDGVLAPHSGSRRPGPHSEPSGFLSPGRCPADAQPTEAETAVWNQVNAVLEEAQTILAELQSYTGAGQEIREAIQNPGDLRLQERAWSAVCPLVAKLKRFYEFSLRLENALRSLLEALTSPPYAPTQHLEREQALAKQFAEILHFTLSFDELKMTNPAIQNDFSYYRRTISRNRINNLQLDAESEVNNEMANRMSLFYAEATPMLKTLSNATTKFVSENKTLPIEDTTDCLSTMACVCRVMLETPEYRSRFTNTETLLFCMRVMVGVIILYDHVHPVGAFAKTSKIDMKGCIKVLKDQPSTSTEGLLNALRYTTRHLNDDTTSKQIRALLQ